MSGWAGDEVEEADKVEEEAEEEDDDDAEEEVEDEDWEEVDEIETDSFFGWLVPVGT